MAMNESNESASLQLSKVLDKLGYSYEMVQYRRQANQEYEHIINKKNGVGQVLLSGSRGEGLSKPFESDVDVLCLCTHVVCVEEELAYVAPPNTSVFTFQPGYQYQGYEILKVRSLDVSTAKSFTNHEAFHITSNGQEMISSDAIVRHQVHQWKNYCSHTNIQTQGRSGPAVTTSGFGLDIDSVISIPTICPSVLKQWLQRPRKYKWPPFELQQRISRMKGNFVAKGCKRSPNEQHEWRLCFNEAELLLVNSWEKTLYKLYILLKVTLKEILRPIDNEKVLSSYVMKNIVFWLAETNPSDSFQEKNLVETVKKALKMLKVSLEKKHLSYYMIPGRNLIDTDSDIKVIENLIKRVESLIQECPHFLYKCEKFEYVRKMSDIELTDFGNKIDELEKRFLSFTNYNYKLKRNKLKGLSDQELAEHKAMFGRLQELLSSTWHPCIQEQLNTCSVSERCEALLK